MQRSEHRILTTHAGSLPRGEALVDLLARRSRREAVDPAAFNAAVMESTRDVVARQLDCGIDVGNNGEQPRESFFTYVQHRLTGFGGESDQPRAFKDMLHYPSFRAHLVSARRAQQPISLGRPPKAIGEVAYADRAPLEQECASFAAALAGQATTFTETFMTAPSPGIVATGMTNAHYARFDDYLHAVADALRTEYEAIVTQGHVLQIDAPDLAMERHVYFGERSLADFLEFVDLTVSAINHALANVPPDRVRLHVCWGNYEGPHTFDVPLEEILPHLLRARVGGLLLALANPRHAHEWRVLQRFPLPDEMLLFAGVIDTTTNYVEHSELVADRIETVARAIGDPRRVIATTDCGFGTSAGSNLVAEELVWEKLRAMRQGADIASRRLF
ncbi:MAG: cobalamin-independent methionine synthase II family protein [Dehalococcoidia bacterium]